MQICTKFWRRIWVPYLQQDLPVCVQHALMYGLTNSTGGPGRVKIWTTYTHGWYMVEANFPKSVRLWGLWWDKFRHDMKLRTGLGAIMLISRCWFWSQPRPCTVLLWLSWALCFCGLHLPVVSWSDCWKTTLIMSIECYFFRVVEQQLWIKVNSDLSVVSICYPLAGTALTFILILLLCARKINSVNKWQTSLLLCIIIQNSTMYRHVKSNSTAPTVPTTYISFWSIFLTKNKANLTRSYESLLSCDEKLTRANYQFVEAGWLLVLEVTQPIKNKISY